MRKPIIVLAISLVIGATGMLLYMTGRLDSVADKILNRQNPPTQSPQEEDFGDILEKVKINLDEVGSVRGAVRRTVQEKFAGNDFYPQEESEGSLEFVFPDKKIVLSDWGGYQLEARIIEDGIYREIPWLSEYRRQDMEQKGISTANPSDWEAWFYAADGHSMPMPIPDSPGDYIHFNLSDYPQGWDFTRNIDKIEQYLGVEEIDGVKCDHYKVKSKKPSPYIGANLSKAESYFLTKIVGLEPVSASQGPGEDDDSEMEEQGNGIRYVFRGYEVLIPLPDSLAMPLMFKSVAVDYEKEDPAAWSYMVNTWAIEGEIWVGKDDLLVHKESYTTETSDYYYYSMVDESNVRGEREISMATIYRNKTDIIYSDFNSGIEIKAPEKFVVVDTNAHDMERKEDLSDIGRGLENIAAQSKRPTVTPYPDTDNRSVKVDSDDFLLKKLKYEFPYRDPLDPDYYYTYKSDGYTYTLTARLEDLEDKDCVMENGMCLYRVKGGNAASGQ